METIIQKLINADSMFWYTDEKGRIKILHRKLVNLIHFLGYVLVKSNGSLKLVHVDIGVLTEATEDDIIIAINNLIDQILPVDLGEGVSRESLQEEWTRSVKILCGKERFKLLKVLNVNSFEDTKEKTYLFFENGIIEIKKDKINILPFGYEEKYVWAEKINKRKLEITTKDNKPGEFEILLLNVCRKKQEMNHSIKTIMGYLLHRYKDQAINKATGFIDEKIGDVGDANGGSCKSLVATALGYLRTVLNVAGKTFKLNSRFSLQGVSEFTDLILINDLRHGENIESYFNIITDDITVEQKYKNQFVIPNSRSPKLLFTTNQLPYYPEGNSSERRLIFAEFSDYYNGTHTPFDEFGHNLFHEWNTKEWNRFDNFMIGCIQLYLTHGLIHPPQININARKLHAQVGFQLVEFLDEKIRIGVTKFNKKDLFDEFLKENPDQRQFVRGRNRFTTKVKKYFLFRELAFIEMPAESKRYFEILPAAGKNQIADLTSPIPIKPSDVDYKTLETE